MKRVVMNETLTCNVHLDTTNVTDYGLVSIVMPNYNSAKFIKATVESVIA